MTKRRQKLQEKLRVSYVNHDKHLEQTLETAPHGPPNSIHPARPSQFLRQGVGRQQLRQQVGEKVRLQQMHWAKCVVNLISF